MVQFIKNIEQNKQKWDDMKSQLGQRKHAQDMYRQ